MLFRSLVVFLSDGAFEEQRGADWAPRWWRADDSGLVAPIMINNGRRIDQRTTMKQEGGVTWFKRHLQLNGFEPLVFDGRELWFCSNRDHAAYRVDPGVHGLSNHLLDEPWPKVVRAREGLDALRQRPFDAEAYFRMLADETPAPDHALPDTGIGLDRERRSSSIRIRDAIYGTRCSSVVRIDDNGSIDFQERSYASSGDVTGTVAFHVSG